jgi:hypothetical protein
MLRCIGIDLYFKPDSEAYRIVVRVFNPSPQQLVIASPATAHLEK